MQQHDGDSRARRAPSSSSSFKGLISQSLFRVLQRFCVSRALSTGLALALLGLVAACGGGGGGGASDGGTGPAPGTGTTPPVAAPTPAPPTVLSLPAAAAGTGTLMAITSTGADSLGGGRSGVYTLANADIGVVVSGSTLRITLRGDDFWDAIIRTSATGSTVVMGQHTGLQQNDAGLQERVGMDLQRERSIRCTQSEALLSVDQVRYEGGRLVEFDLRLAQRCGGDTGLLQAQVRWVAAEQPVRAAAPAVPASLWRPASGSVPASGNVVLIETTGSEPVFEGRSRVFSERDAAISVDTAGDRIEMVVNGSDTWFAQLRGIRRPEGLQPGFYDQLRGFVRGYNPARGALEWYRGTAACDAPRGWFALDRLVLERGRLLAIEFRFEQRCLGQAGVVRGLVRWDAAVRQLPPVPGPAPNGLWAPASGSVPATGNHFLVVSAPGEPVGAGRTWLYTGTGAQFVVYDNLGALNATVTETSTGTQWRAVLRSRGTASRLEPGYRAPLGSMWNPAIGGIQVTGDARGCDVAEGWFVVDEVSHRHGVLRHVALRFQMRCRGSEVPLHGSLRWTSEDPTILAGPADLPPAQATLSPPPVVPAQGSAALFESRGREFIGQGGDWLYTPRNALLYAELLGGGSAMRFGVRGDEDWNGAFQPLVGTARLQPGRYAMEAPSVTPGSGYSFVMGAMGRGCSPSGWFEILALETSGDLLRRVELRFEMTCDDSPYPLLGHFRWQADDTGPPIAQPQPLPPDLWAPPAGAMPASANAIYVQANPGGFVGAGRTTLLQSTPATPPPSQVGSLLQLTFSEPSTGTAVIRLEPPGGALLLQPGYCPGTVGIGTHPWRMKVALNMDGRGCNEAQGWLAIDDVAYDNQGLLRIALRLQQLCDAAGPPAMAALRWARPTP